MGPSLEIDRSRTEAERASAISLSIQGGSRLERLAIQEALQTESLEVVDAGTFDNPTSKAAVRHASDAPAGWIAIRPELSQLHTLREQTGDATLIVVLADEAIDTVATALTLGADAVVTPNATARSLALTVMAAVEGSSVLPTAVAKWLAGGFAEASLFRLSMDELDLLRDLLDEVPIPVIAERHSYSVRALHRKLRLLYEHLGVEGRIGAVALAARWNLDIAMSDLTASVGTLETQN